MAEEISPLENHGWWMERLLKDAKANRPEALRLAHWLERDGANCQAHIDAAAELRRLHVRNQELLEALKRAEPFVEGRMLDCEAIYDDSKDGWHYEAYATARDALEQVRAALKEKNK